MFIAEVTLDEKERKCETRRDINQMQTNARNVNLGHPCRI